MKNKYLLVATILSLNLSISQNSKGFVTYKKEYITNLTSTEKGKKLFKENPRVFEKTKKIEIRSNELLKDINFQLTFSDKTSLFKVENILEAENNIYFKFAVGSEGSAIYYVNKKNNISKTQLDAYGQKFIITNSKISWKLMNETKKIGKYNCYKAITIKITKGRNGLIKTPITAWYAPSLPYSFGPLGYYGLPGLIVELELHNFKYYASEIVLNPKEKILIKEPSKGKTVTKGEFDEIGLKLMKDRNGF